MILEVAAIDAYYGETQALYGVSLGVARGEVLALLGPNGAGKTTTIRSILGLTRPRRGAIRFYDRDITRAATHSGLWIIPGSAAARASTASESPTADISWSLG